MHTRRLLLPVLAILLTGLVTAAPAASQEAQDPSGPVKATATVKAPLGVPLTFSVDGLTKDNIEQTARGLTSLTERVYVCPSCKHEEAAAGKCDPCGVERAARNVPILFEAVPSLEKASIQLTPFAARTLRYSDLEEALGKNAIEIEGAKFPLAGESRLVLRGGSAESLKAIEKALDASGFFDSAKASYDAKSTEIHVLVQANGTPPMHDKVATAIHGLDSKATLADVIWGPFPAKT